MKKIYQAPETRVVRVASKAALLTLSLGNNYNSTDVTYGRHGNSGFWDDEDEEY